MQNQPLEKAGELLTIKDVAKIVKVHPLTVFHWIQNSKLKAYKAGGQWRIYPADLQAFLKSG